MCIQISPIDALTILCNLLEPLREALDSVERCFAEALNVESLASEQQAAPTTAASPLVDDTVLATSNVQPPAGLHFDR